MSDENTGTPAQAQATSPEQTIPKYRLDEVLAQKRALEEQAKFWQQTAVQMQQGMNPQRQQGGMSSQEAERLRRLKEENPEAYRAEVRAMKLQQEVGQTKQAVAAMWDMQDRQSLVAKYKGAERRLEEIDNTIEALRAQGNFGVTREQVYLWTLGQEKIREESQKAQTPQVAPQVAQQISQAVDEFPSTNATSASTLQGGKAPSSASNKSFAEIEKEIQDLEF